MSEHLEPIIPAWVSIAVVMGLVIALLFALGFGLAWLHGVLS